MAAPFIAAAWPYLVKGAEWAFTAYNLYTAAKEVPTVIERTKAVVNGDKEQIAPLAIDTVVLGLTSYFGVKGLGGLIESVKGSKLLAGSVTKSLTEAERNVSVGKTAELAKVTKETSVPGVSKSKFGKLTEGMSSKTMKIFEKDVAENPALLKQFAKNPELIKTYENLIGTKYRTDISVLRYVSNGADKFYGKISKESGKDLVFKDVRNVTKITDQSGNYLGKIVGKNENGGFVIDVSKAERNTLSNLSPMSNAKYIDRNKCVTTDKFGRPIEYRVTIDETVEAAGRNKLNIYKAKNVKEYYGANGEQVSKIAKNDEGGHGIPDSWGGSSNSLNIVPQNLNINRGGIWRKSEISGLEAAKAGNKVERIIKVKYPDNNSLRPSDFIVEQKVNGAYDVKGGLRPTTIKNDFE